MTKNGICAKCKRPIKQDVLCPYILIDANNNKYCSECAMEMLGQYVMYEDKKLLEELSKK